VAPIPEDAPVMRAIGLGTSPIVPEGLADGSGPEVTQPGGVVGPQPGIQQGAAPTYT
jgi:hypothetical protein